jgi:hypothetical protein
MTRQGDLYDPMCATHKARQGRSPSGFLACPLGHGRLVRLPGDPEPADDWDRPSNAAP